MNKLNKVTFLVLVFLAIFSICFPQENNKQNSTEKMSVAGLLTPNGKPVKDPIRINAGESCIIDLIQLYTISGNISGSIEMNYRILVYGKCGSPPGTYNEEWIAYGRFNGTFNGKMFDSNLSYTAKVKKGGDVDGIIVFGKGLKAELRIYGNFSNGNLSYKGEVY